MSTMAKHISKKVNMLPEKDKTKTLQKTRRFYEMLQKRSSQAKKKPEKFVLLEEET